jgi:hypothetical protein
LILAVYDDITQKMLRHGWFTLKRSLNQGQLIHAEFFEESVYSYLYSKQLIRFSQKWKTDDILPHEALLFFKFVDDSCFEISAFYGLIHLLNGDGGIGLRVCMEFVRLAEYWTAMSFSCIQSKKDVCELMQNDTDHLSLSALKFVWWRIACLFPDSSVISEVSFSFFSDKVIGMPSFNKLANVFANIENLPAFEDVE